MALRWYVHGVYYCLHKKDDQNTLESTKIPWIQQKSLQPSSFDSAKSEEERSSGFS